ncbi:MAG: hypothetical protein IT462_13615 [Planctomycetes bacterium]|nr:hypothetical protein [Planctomycetota bacterium]
MYRVMALAVALIAGLALAIPGMAQDDDVVIEEDIIEEAPVPPAPAIEKTKIATGLLHVREWGVDTLAWDGGPEPKYDAEMLPYFYDVCEVPITPEPRPVVDEPAPKPERTRTARGAKPIVYFDCDKDVTFTCKVRYTQGAVTWMYPKPTRRTGKDRVEWENVSLFADGVKREKSPALAALEHAPADHWANFSRDGGTGSLSISGEHERYLFYEGNPFQPFEADVFKDAKGDYILRNYGASPLYDLRVALKTDTGVKAWYVRELAAATAIPADQKLDERAAIAWGNEGKPGVLAASVEADGLTARQATAFDRAWRDDFFAADGNVLSYRRSRAEVDARCELTVTCSGTPVRIHRSGWVFVHDIDLARQAEIEALVTAAIKNDEESAKKLIGLGIAGVNAIRRAMSNVEEPLSRRVAMAKLLKRCVP